jgi:hypothetical protein
LPRSFCVILIIAGPSLIAVGIVGLLIIHFRRKLE